MTNVVLKIAGQQFGGWTAVRVRRSMESLAGLFELTLTEKQGDILALNILPVGVQVTREIGPGDRCTVWLNDQQIIDGYIDDVAIRYNATQHSIHVRGRDKTADLVDCSAKHEGGQFINQTLMQIASALVSPFDITVLNDTDIGEKFRSEAINEGETVYEVLDRLARMRGVLLFTGNDGVLHITRASTSRLGALLRLGANILSCNALLSSRERYYRYTVKGQQPGDDDTFGEAAAQVKAEAIDTNIRSNRELLVVAGDDVTIKACEDVAKFERNVRIGRSARATYQVQGWTHDNTNLWPLNRLVPVSDEFAGIKRDLLISSVTHLLDDQGTRTELELVPREAYDIMATTQAEKRTPVVDDFWARINQ